MTEDSIGTDIREFWIKKVLPKYLVHHPEYKNESTRYQLNKMFENMCSKGIIKKDKKTGKFLLPRLTHGDFN